MDPTSKSSLEPFTGTDHSGLILKLRLKGGPLKDSNENCSIYTKKLSLESMTSIFKLLFQNGDIEGFASLSCTDTFFYNASKGFLKGKSIIQLFCPNWIFMDAKAQGMVIDDEPRVKLRETYEFYSKNNAKGMLITVCKGETTNQVIRDAEKIGMKILWRIEAHWSSGEKGSHHRPAVFSDPAVNETSRRFITTDFVPKTDDRSSSDQHNAVCEAGYEGISALYLYFKAAVCARKVLGISLFDKHSWRSSSPAIPYETTKSGNFVFAKERDQQKGDTFYLFDHTLYNRKECRAVGWKQF